MKRQSLWRAVPVLALLVFILLALDILPQSSDSANDQIVTIHSQMLDNVRRERPVQALYQAEAIAAQTGWTTELLRTAGEMAYTLGDNQQATSYWAAIPERDLSLSLLRQLASIHYALQDWDSFATDVEHLLALAPDDAWAHYSRGWMLAVTHPQDAQPHLRAAMRDPLYQDITSDLFSVVQTTTAHLPIQIGITLAQNDRWPEAEFAFQQAATTDGPIAEAHAYAAIARDQQGKDGQPEIQQAVTLAPENALVRFLEGLHLRIQHDLTGSLEAFQLAAVLNPVNPAYAAELGNAYQMTDQLTLAEFWLKHAVTLSGNDPRFQQLLDTFYSQTLPN